MRHLLLAATAFAGIAVATAAHAQPAPLAADTPSRTPSGATFTAPKAWSLAIAGPAAVIAAPEGDTRIVLVDVGPAPDARAAAAAAWKAYRPEAPARPVKLVSPGPARNGWEERQTVSYETSPNEKAAVQSIALRKGTAWTVFLIDGSDATIEKRLGAVALIAQSLRPAGYARESFAGMTAHPMDAARVEALRAFVAQSIAELGVPGAGIAIVDHGRVVYEGGVGVKQLGRPDPVDAHTEFMIASNTKGMSTLLLAQLVDEGKLNWDDPVTKVYPAFRLGSAATTKKVLIRNLVCACTGLPRKDLDWVFKTTRTTPASTTFDQLAETEPTSGFGEVFQYNNLMASAAGYIGGHLVHPEMEIGAAYDAAMQEKVFGPLGMRETIFPIPAAQAGDYARPYGMDLDGKPSLIAMDYNYLVGPYRPAGGAWSTAHDMIRYVENELSGGIAPGGKRMVSEKNLLRRRAPNVPIGESATYGMGLEVDTTWGVPVVHHGGSMFGYKSDWVALPDAQVGAVILTNADEGQALLRPFMRRLLEILYDGKEEAAGDVAAAAKRQKAELAAERPRLAVPPAHSPAAALAARYSNADLGTLSVRHEGAGVIFDNGTWSTHMASRRNDDGTLSFIAIDPGIIGSEFVVGGAAGKPTLTTRDGQHEYVFVGAR